jgi:hypothetical protein
MNYSKIKKVVNEDLGDDIIGIHIVVALITSYGSKEMNELNDEQFNKLCSFVRCAWDEFDGDVYYITDAMNRLQYGEDYEYNDGEGEFSFNDYINRSEKAIEFVIDYAYKLKDK